MRALAATTNGAVDLTLDVSTFQSFTFVVQFFAAADTHQNLHNSTVVKVGRQGHERQAFFQGPSGQLAELTFVDE